VVQCSKPQLRCAWHLCRWEKSGVGSRIWLNTHPDAQVTLDDMDVLPLPAVIKTQRAAAGAMHSATVAGLSNAALLMALTTITVTNCSGVGGVGMEASDTAKQRGCRHPRQSTTAVRRGCSRPKHTVGGKDVDAPSDTT
jgi:hypothetical protein